MIATATDPGALLAALGRVDAVGDGVLADAQR